MCLFPYDTVNSSFYIALFARHLDVFWYAHWNPSRCLAKIAIYNEDSTVSEGVSFRSPAWPEHKGHINVDLSWRLCISKAHSGVTSCWQASPCLSTHSTPTLQQTDLAVTTLKTRGQPTGIRCMQCKSAPSRQACLTICTPCIYQLRTLTCQERSTINRNTLAKHFCGCMNWLCYSE